MNNNYYEKQLVIGIVFVSIIFASFIFYVGKKVVTANINRNKTVITIANKTETGPLTVNNLLAHFSDWDKTVFKISPIMLEIKNKAILTIMPENEYVKWAEVVVLAPNTKAESLTDDELAPIKKLLAAILPDWKEGESWLKNNLSNLPASTTKDKWQLKLTYASNTGLTLTASQILPFVSASSSNTTQKSSSASSATSQSKADPVLADDFEKLVVTNGRPLIFAASVEDDKGPAVGKSDSKILAIWVTRDWDFLTDIDKRTLVKLHYNVFTQWRGKDDGIVSVFDATDTELAFGTKYSTKIYK